MANEVPVPNMKIPTVHLNGTSGAVLLKSVRDQATAVRAAIDALCAGSPHGRDYYTQDAFSGTAFETARKQHDARIEALRGIYSELLTISMGIADQLDARTHGAGSK